MTALDRDAIQAVIPHRDPFLFVDEIVELEPGVRALGRWTITGDEWFLQGHFPGNPIVPGVIMVEAAAQTAAVCALAVCQPAIARIVSVRIDRVEPFAGGASFGASGAYERVIGVAKGELDPADKRNAGIVGIERAPPVIQRDVRARAHRGDGADVVEGNVESAIARTGARHQRVRIA